MTGMPSLLAVTLHSLPLRRIVSPISGGGYALEASISKVPSGKRISKLRPGMSAGCPPAATPNLGRRLGYTSPSRTGPSWSATSTPRSSARPVGGSSSTRKIASRSAIDRATRACSASSGRGAHRLCPRSRPRTRAQPGRQRSLRGRKHRRASRADATRRSGVSNGSRFARISPVLKLATARERGGFFRDETRAARISFPREPKAKRGNP